MSVISLARLVAAASLLSVVGAPRSADAQGLTCADIEFDASAVEEFPSVAQSCHSVVERDGKLFVRLVADVVSVRSDGSVVLVLKGPDGSRIRQVYDPPPGFQPILSGRASSMRRLARGQEIRLYLPSDRWHVADSRGE